MPENTRGGFDPVTRNILLGDKADFTTFAHEAGHYYLSVLSELASQENAQGWIKHDMDTAHIAFAAALGHPEVLRLVGGAAEAAPLLVVGDGPWIIAGRVEDGIVPQFRANYLQESLKSVVSRP